MNIGTVVKMGNNHWVLVNYVTKKACGNVVVKEFYMLPPKDNFTEVVKPFTHARAAQSTPIQLSSLGLEETKRYEELKQGRFEIWTN